MKFISLILICHLTFQISAQITLVKDLNEGTASTDCYCSANFTLEQGCFVALDESTTLIKLSTINTGYELYKITASGVDLVADIMSGSETSNIEHMTFYKGLIYFIANDGSGYRIWETDGTADGTKISIDLGDSDTQAYDIEGFLLGQDDNLYFEFEGSIYFTDGTTLTKVDYGNDINVYTYGNLNSRSWCGYKEGIAVINYNGTNWELLSISADGATSLATLDMTSDFEDPYGMAEFGGGLIFNFGADSGAAEGLYSFTSSTGEISKLQDVSATRISSINSESCLVSIDGNYLIFDSENTTGKMIGAGNLYLTSGEDWSTAEVGYNILFSKLIDFGEPNTFNVDIKPITIIDGFLYYFAGLESELGTEIYKSPVGLSTSTEEVPVPNELSLNKVSQFEYTIQHSDIKNLQIQIIDLSGRKISAFNTYTNTAFRIPEGGIYILLVNNKKAFKIYSN